MIPISMSATGWEKSSRPAGGLQDVLRVPDVRVEVVARTLGAAAQQGPGVRQHQGIVVHVDDPRLRRDGLGHLVGVVRGGQAGAEGKIALYASPASRSTA
jgi:hypothetical protein